MEKSATQPDDHIDSLPDGIREDLRRIDSVISEAMPGVSRTLWEGKLWGGSEQKIIGYGDFSYRNSSGADVEWFMVGLAAQKHHLSVYVNAVADDGYLVQKYADRLGKVKVGSAVVSFKRVDDVDLGGLRELVSLAAKQLQL